MDPAEAPPLVLGTAGHIDHGKTTLIHALTGTNTDRLPEEQARGITIDLGFAALDLGDGQKLAVVDVPGHEKLVRTMVSGAAGIDLVLLVVAADEGVMPQTREHIAICTLLGIERGVVALTKADLVDEETVELATEEMRDLLASTSLADVPIVALSSQTGEGLDELRACLRKLAIETPPRTPRLGSARLAIDRVFAMRGFGTVVTGTLIGGSFDVGDQVEIHPRDKKARIRGLQSHGESVERLSPGVRCAINLQGIDTAEISRGDVVARSDAVVATRTADLELWWLEGAPETEDVVSIEFLTGTAERRARLAPIARKGFEPGQRGFARLHIDGEPIPLLPGDRFIARGFARTDGAGGTLGGGVVLDVAPPRRRRSDPELLRELEVFSKGNAEQGVFERIARTGWTGIEEETLRHETGHDPASLRLLLDRVSEQGRIVRAGARRWLSAEVVTKMEARLTSALEAFHAAEPLRPGMSRGTLRGQLPENVSSESADLAMARLEQQGVLAIEGEYARLSEHRPSLDAETQALVERIKHEARDAGLEAASVRDWSDRLGVPTERFRDLVAHLEREGILVRAPGDLFFDRAAIDTLRDRVAAHFATHEELDTQAYKDLIGTSRRTAMPLMELLDDLHVTRRRGDVRVRRTG